MNHLNGLKEEIRRRGLVVVKSTNCYSGHIGMWFIAFGDFQKHSVYEQVTCSFFNTKEEAQVAMDKMLLTGEVPTLTPDGGEAG